MKENCVMGDNFTFKVNSSSLVCIDRCLWEYHGYYAAYMTFDKNLFPALFVLQVENRIPTKVVNTIESVVDPPPWKIGALDLKDFHKILVKRE